MGMFVWMEEIENEAWNEVFGEYRGGDWGDWSDIDDTIYQRTHVVLRDGEVTLSNEWEATDVLPDGKHVSGFRMMKGFLGLLGSESLDDSNDSIFFLEPNMKALNKAGMFK